MGPHVPHGTARGLRSHMLTRRACLLTVAAVVVLLSSATVGGAPSESTARFSWTLMPRYVENFALPRFPHVSLLNISPPHAYLHSERRSVSFDACRSGPDVVSYVWRIDFLPAVDRGKECTYRHTFHSLGQHRVELSVQDAFGGRTSTAEMVEIRDLLIVSIGDSYASGEGVPDVPGRHELDWNSCLGRGTRCVRVRTMEEAWTHGACHRSSRAGPPLAARWLENEAHSTVTFVSVACSGAEIEKGLVIGGHRGQLAQVEELTRLLCPPLVACASPEDLRPIDALVITVGGNDIGFSHIISDCVFDFNRCTEGRFPIGLCLKAVEPRLRSLGPDQQWILRRACNEDPGRVAQRMMSELPAKYASLDAVIRARLRFTTPAGIWITEYSDPSTTSDGRTCGFGGFPLEKEIAASDVTWLRQHVFIPLNEAIRSSAKSLAWGFVDDIARRYHGHGYCSSDAWFVTYRESWRVQGDLQGTLHPNRRGHEVFGHRVAEVLGRQIFRR